MCCLMLTFKFPYGILIDEDFLGLYYQFSACVGSDSTALHVSDVIEMHRNGHKRTFHCIITVATVLD